MNETWRSRDKIPHFLTVALGSKLSASCTSHFTAWKRAPGAQRIWWLVGRRTSLDVAWREITLSLLQIKTRSPSLQPVTYLTKLTLLSSIYNRDLNIFTVTSVNFDVTPPVLKYFQWLFHFCYQTKKSNTQIHHHCS